ncbi:MAG: glycosyltransferase family 2 protein [Bacteroidota bacterium]
MNQIKEIEMPFISVITINKNNADGLNKTMQSVCTQDFEDFEYIVVDGASEDKSGEVVKNYLADVDKFISGNDKGIYDAMNKGIRAAKGDYLIFLNSGDCFADASVLTQMHVHCRGEDLLSGNIIFLENNISRRDFTPERLTKFYLLHSMLYHPATFFKKSLFKTLGLFDDQLSIVGDYEFFLRALSKNKINYRHLPFDVVLFDSSGISSAKITREKMMDERKMVQRKYYNKVLLFIYNLYKSR